ncbi:MAG: hypothetical protein E7262_10605 [Lachnospiraceae bacterium]|nr:hypothetical protein [Lachnospiraceae bacterium]
MNKFISYNNSILETKYKLIYHHKIDISHILNEIKETPEYADFIKLTNIDRNLTHDFFFSIFNKIYKNIKPHVDMFSDKVNSNFFGVNNSNGANLQEEEYKNNIINDLFYHCLTTGFLYSLETTSSNCESTLSSKYHNYNKKGYFDCNQYDIKKHRLDPADSLPQKYNNMYKRLRDSKTNYYSTYILNAMSSTCNTEKDFTIANYKKNIALFLFENSSISKFSKSLDIHSRSTNFIKAYNDIYDDCLSEANTYNDLDTFVFQNFMEYIYGFNISNYICQFFDNIKINVKTYSSSKRGLQLSDLNNPTLKANMSLVLDCPAIHARKNLLDYALFKLVNVNSFNGNFLNKHHNSELEYINSIFKHYDLEHTKDELIRDANIHFKDFFTYINNITIPILEDLWLVLTYELFSDSHVNMLETYQDYLKTHLNNLFDFKADYGQYKPSTRNILVDALYKTCTKSHLNNTLNSIPIYPTTTYSEKDRIYIYQNIKLLLDYYTT